MEGRRVEENLGGSLTQALEMHEMMAAEEKEHFTDETFGKRRISGERMEKQIFTNFIFHSNHRKRTRHQSVKVSKISGS